MQTNVETLESHRIGANFVSSGFRTIFEWLLESGERERAGSAKYANKCEEDAEGMYRGRKNYELSDSGRIIRKNAYKSSLW